MTFSFKHPSLSSTLDGVEFPLGFHFRGIPYGQVPSRFAAPEAISNYPTRLDCTQYGPRCPQVRVDVGHLLRVPVDHVFPREPENEFECLNLDVALPQESLSKGQKLPVMVWIHGRFPDISFLRHKLTTLAGGSQAVTFGSAASGICDPKTIVQDSIRLNMPIIIVSVQYRLNIFAFGRNSDAVNLALKDQMVALEWVQRHIAGFGGDPDKVTLAGESAGAVYCHAHLVKRAPVSQFVLSSGSLHLSPPQPMEKATALRQTVEKHLRELGDYDLLSAPVDILVEAVAKSGIQSWFLLADSQFENWQGTTGIAGALLVSDMKNESIIWQRGICSADTVEIVNSFDLAGEHADKLKQLYHVHSNRRSATITGALDFINDYKFVLPSETLVQLWLAESKRVFRCLIDEPNPWQHSTGAHHALDLVLLFGAFDLPSSDTANVVGKQMRECWLNFIHANNPWSSSKYAAFGPHGSFLELEPSEIISRRRIGQVEYLKQIPTPILDKVFFALAAGRISLLN